jgi:hypothetical protein
MKKPKFNKHTVADVVRVTKICYVTDREIWQQLVTPIAKSFLGPIQSSEVRMLETEKGLFPGDEVSNLPDHRLYGGQLGYLRFPYLHTMYKTARGAFIVKRDGVKFEAIGWYGDVMKGRGRLMFKFALRDRAFDGTRAANDSSLVDFPYDDAVLNGRLPVEAKSVEVSIYGFTPGSRVADSGMKEYDQFLEKPFTFLDRPELFLKYFQVAWDSERAPGQNAAPLPDVSQLTPPEFEKIALKYGYDFIENAASHYHVAMWAQSLGYRFTDPNKAKIMAEFAEGMKRIRASGRSLTRSQESWVCVVQSLPKELIPEGLYLGGIKWPQDNIGPANLWMNKPLSEKAKKLLP